MTEENFFSHIREHYREDLPFVVYRLPNKSAETKALLQKDNQVHQVKNYSESGFVFAPFDLGKEVVLIPEKESEKILWKQTGSLAPENNMMSSPEEASETGKREHMELVERAVTAIVSGRMDKVVVSRKEEVALESEDPLRIFGDLLRNYSEAFVYCWFHPKVGLWLGATPETLLKAEGNLFETMALAGTQKFDGEVEVNWGAKEKQEQQLVTDAILQELSALKDVITDVDFSEPYTSRAGNLLHLRTDIKGRLKSGEQLREIISALHPTPAVGGLPKENARNFILAEETYDREFYTGFLGELNISQRKERSRTRRNVENLAYAAVRKRSSLFVNLRCMKIEENSAVLFIGGGITKDSVSEDEWQETVHKAQTIKKVLRK